MNQEIEELKKYLLDPRKDYRKELSKFRVNNNGDLQAMSRNGQWETLIPRQRLIEPDWISHMKEKCLVNFGEFICAYFKALEMQGIHNLQIVLYGFDDGFKFADGK